MSKVLPTPETIEVQKYSWPQLQEYAPLIIKNVQLSSFFSCSVSAFCLNCACNQNHGRAVRHEFLSIRAGVCCEMRGTGGFANRRKIFMPQSQRGSHYTQASSQNSARQPSARHLLSQSKERTSSQGKAAPSPENTPGIHEYLSVQSQTVTPMQPLTARHAPITL